MKNIHIVKSEYGNFLIEIKTKIEKVNNLTYYFAEEFNGGFGVKASGFDIDQVKRDMKFLYEHQIDLWFDNQVSDLNIVFEKKLWDFKTKTWKKKK